VSSLVEAEQRAAHTDEENHDRVDRDKCSYRPHFVPEL